MEKLLKLKEVAELLGFERKTVRRLCDKGLLRYTTIGRQLRFRQKWLDELIEKGD